MLSSLSRRLRYAPVVPGKLTYCIIFVLGRIALRLGVLSPDTHIEYIARDDWLLVLTPLAGSSTVRAKASDIRRLDLRGNCELSGKRVLFMDRPYAARMRSFYNKKVRNPTNVAKAILLATCPPLTHATTPDRFVDYVLGVVPRTDKDKHLYTFEQICAAIGRAPAEVERVHIERDRALLESLLGTSLEHVVNSSNAVATHAEPLELPPDAFVCLEESAP